MPAPSSSPARATATSAAQDLARPEALLAGHAAPAADMVAAMLLHEPGPTHLLACHPRLSERIRRVCGTVLPLPARLLREPVSEPRRPRATTLPEGALAATTYAGQTAAGADVAPSAPQASVQHDLIQAHSGMERPFRTQTAKGGRACNACRARPSSVCPPGLMMDPTNARERRWWEVRCPGVGPRRPYPGRRSGATPPAPHAGVRARDRTSLAGAPIALRRQVVHDARDLLTAQMVASVRVIACGG